MKNKILQIIEGSRDDRSIRSRAFCMSCSKYRSSLPDEIARTTEDVYGLRARPFRGIHRFRGKSHVPAHFLKSAETAHKY